MLSLFSVCCDVMMGARTKTNLEKKFFPGDLDGHCYTQYYFTFTGCSQFSDDSLLNENQLSLQRKYFSMHFKHIFLSS